MTTLMNFLIILGWAVAFRWGYMVGRDEWRGYYDMCMKSKTTKRREK